MNIRTVKTRFDLQEPFASKTVSGLKVTYKAGWAAVDIHVWSRGGGAGSLAVSLQDAWALVQRLLGADLDRCTITQTEE